MLVISKQIIDQCHREELTCVEFRCVHRPHDRVDLPSRSYTENKMRVNRNLPQSISQQSEMCNYLLEMSPFTRGVWGFLVTTLAVALLTWGDTEQDKGNSKGELCRMLTLKPTNSGESPLTSIFLPSTIVPFSFSLARSASVALSKVTNPKPCRFTRSHCLDFFFH